MTGSSSWSNSRLCGYKQSCTAAKHAFYSNKGPVSLPVSQIYKSWQFGPCIKENNLLVFLTTGVIKAQSTLLSLSYLYVHLKMKTNLSVCVPGQFPFLDLHHWGEDSWTAGGTLKHIYRKLLSLKCMTKNKFMNHHCSCSAVQKHLFSTSVSTSLI